jgi:K+ transporter
MTTDTLIHTARAPATPHRPPNSSLLALSALGVVFGDIGASLI